MQQEFIIRGLLLTGFRGLSLEQLARILTFRLPTAGGEFAAIGNDTMMTATILGQKIWTVFDVSEEYYGGLNFQRMRVIPEAQQQGLARQVLANRLALSTLVGIEQWRASFIDMGSYSFARFGFIPHPEQWESLRHSATNRLMTYEFNWVRNPANGEMLQSLRALLNNPDPASIWQIADFPATSNGRSMGRALLMTNPWSGAISLTNAAQLQRLTRSIGADLVAAARANALSVVGRPAP